jgi:hypothetical protein
MVLPTKHLQPSRSLIALGAELLGLLDRPRTVSNLWDSVRSRRGAAGEADVTFDWFVLALDFLFIVKAVDLAHNRIVRRRA